MYYLNNSRVTRRDLQVLEDWIYLYYLNTWQSINVANRFLRIEFICIIWTNRTVRPSVPRSWGLNLFVLFEHEIINKVDKMCSWGLNLFVLFEQVRFKYNIKCVLEDWIYLYYLNNHTSNWFITCVLEDWIYLYYLNK